MGFIQPGTGYNFVNSEDGSSLEILFPEVAASAPEQFKVEMNGNNVYVAQGRLLAMHSLTSSPVYSSDQALLEFNVQGFAVFPTGSRTEGADVPNSLWASDGYVTIQNYVPAQGEEPAYGSNTWGVYIIRNQAETGGNSGSLPVLCVMAEGSDALLKSTAFPTDTEGQLRIKTYVQTLAINVAGTPGGAGDLVVSSMNHILVNYAAERIKIASMVYDSGAWKVKQLLIGSLTLPGSIGTAPVEYNPAAPPGYPGVTYPGFAATNDDWWYTPWSGYTKYLTGGFGYTTTVVAS